MSSEKACYCFFFYSTLNHENGLLQFGVLAKIQQQKQKKLIGISIAFFF